MHSLQAMLRLQGRTGSSGPAVLGALGRSLLSQLWSRPVTSASSARPVIAAKQPFRVELKPGKGYAWCACGYSKKQPFCDGSHKRCAPGISSLRFKLDEAKEAWLCGCKYTKTPPYCDGTHKEDFVQKSELQSHPQL